MPYVKRDPSGNIIELHEMPEDSDTEWLELFDAEVLNFLKTTQNTKNAKVALNALDAEMIRVVEDLIDLLIDKQVILFTELPEAVQHKLGARKMLRSKMESLENLIGEDQKLL